MKKSIIAFSIMTTILISFAQSAFAGSKVSGYYRKDGTYVQSHYRSSSNDTKRDNWSTYGNTNPHTGEDGTKKYYNYNNYGRNHTNSYDYRSDRYDD